MIAPGFLLLNKHANINSTGCVTRIKTVLGCRNLKIGHAGTLDSFATGLLIIGIGREATRHIDQIMTLDKQYTATGKLGILTNTYDLTGTILQEMAIPPHITAAKLADALRSFGSAYSQTPPIYSALKHNGRRLSSIARSADESIHELQKIAEYKQRTVQLFNMQLIAYQSPFFTLHAHVSHGTYIRSLIHDIGQRTEIPATTCTLERTAIGPFKLSNAHSLHSLNSMEAITSNLIDPKSFLAQLSEHAVSYNR